MKNRVPTMRGDLGSSRCDRATKPRAKGMESQERREPRGDRDAKTKWTHLRVCSNWNLSNCAVVEIFVGAN